MRAVLCNTGAGFRDEFKLDRLYFKQLEAAGISYREVGEKQGYSVNIAFTIENITKLTQQLNKEIIVRNDTINGLPIIEIYDDWRE